MGRGGQEVGLGLQTNQPQRTKMMNLDRTDTPAAHRIYALICPTGKSMRPGDGSPVQSHPKKYSVSRSTQIKSIFRASRLSEGRFAIVTDVRRDAVDASGASDEGACSRTAKSCGPDAPTLVSSWWSNLPATVTKKPGHRGELEGNR